MSEGEKKEEKKKRGVRSFLGKKRKGEAVVEKEKGEDSEERMEEVSVSEEGGKKKGRAKRLFGKVKKRVKKTKKEIKEKVEKKKIERQATTPEVTAQLIINQVNEIELGVLDENQITLLNTIKGLINAQPEGAWLLMQDDEYLKNYSDEFKAKVRAYVCCLDETISAFYALYSVNEIFTDQRLLKSGLGAKDIGEGGKRKAKGEPKLVQQVNALISALVEEGLQPGNEENYKQIKVTLVVATSRFERVISDRTGKVKVKVGRGKMQHKAYKQAYDVIRAGSLSDFNSLPPANKEVGEADAEKIDENVQKCLEIQGIELTGGKELGV